MYSFLSKNGQSISFILGIVVTVVFFLLATNSGYDLSLLSSDMFSGRDASEVSETLSNITNFNFGFSATYIMLVLAVVLAVVMPIIYTIMNPGKGALVGLIGVVALAIIFFIGYSMSANEVDTYGVTKAMADFEVSAKQGQYISGGIKASIITLGLSIVLLVVFEILNIFK